MGKMTDADPANCLTSRLPGLLDEIGDRRLSHAHRAAALRMVIHLVGDLHQARYQAQEVLASIRAQERADFEASKVNNPAFQPQPQPRKATCTTNGGISTCNIK